MNRRGFLAALAALVVAPVVMWRTAPRATRADLLYGFPMMEPALSCRMVDDWTGLAINPSLEWTANPMLQPGDAFVFDGHFHVEPER